MYEMGARGGNGIATDRKVLHTILDNAYHPVVDCGTCTLDLSKFVLILPSHV